MNIDMNMLYTDGTKCKLCLRVRGDHLESCPGIVLDGLIYEIRITGANCTRGCCGYTDTSVDGPSLEAIAERAVRAGSEAVQPCYDARAVFEIGSPTKLIAEAALRIEEREASEKAAREAMEAEIDRAASHKAALAQLEEDKSDLSVDGYARRKEAIEAEFGATPE